MKVKRQGFLRKGRKIWQLWGYFLEDQAFPLGLKMETDTKVCRVGRGNGRMRLAGGWGEGYDQRKVRMRSKWKEQGHEGKNTVFREQKCSERFMHYC